MKPPKLETQMQFLKTNLLGKPDPDTPLPTPSSVDNFGIERIHRPNENTKPNKHTKPIDPGTLL